MYLKHVFDHIIEEVRKRTTVDDDFAITVLYSEKDRGFQVHVNVDYLKTGADCSDLSCTPFSEDGVFEQATDASKRQTFIAIHTTGPEDAEEKAGLIHLHL